MAYPAEGLESVYRNKITDVSAFLKKYHKDKYLVVNCSNRKYDYKYFDNNVLDMYWPNHYPCPFDEFAKTILKTVNFLIENKENVVAVHCLAGKGRTGSLVNSVLYVSGKYKSIKEINDLYLSRRAVAVD